MLCALLSFASEVRERGQQHDFGIENLGTLWVHVKSAIFSEALVLVPAEGLGFQAALRLPRPVATQWAGIERAVGNGVEQLSSFLAIFLAHWFYAEPILQCDQHLNDGVIFAQQFEGRSQRPEIECLHGSLSPFVATKRQPTGIFVESLGPPSESPRRAPP